MSPRADNPLDQLETPAVRDLAWACFSPPLLLSEALGGPAPPPANCTLPLTPERLHWLQSLDRSPRMLQAHLAENRSERLGLYFESLWHFFLQQDEQTDLLAHNLPVRSGGRTLGEFDCIYYCRDRDCTVHLELAVKFYLGRPRSGRPGPHSQWDQWLGPNTRDRLDRKIGRLLGHQIRLSEQPEARSLLEELGVTRLRREVEIKGRLFYPAGLGMGPPRGWPAAQRRYQWWTPSTLHRKVAGMKCAFTCLERSDWLATLQPGQNRCSLTGEAAVELAVQKFHVCGSPLMFVALDQAGREAERFFVAPEGWPDPA